MLTKYSVNQNAVSLMISIQKNLSKDMGEARPVRPPLDPLLAMVLCNSAAWHSDNTLWVDLAKVFHSSYVPQVLLVTCQQGANIKPALPNVMLLFRALRLT